MPTRKTRGFLFGVFAMSIPVQLVLLYITFGTPVFRFAAIGVALSPVVYLGAAVGLPLGDRMGRARLRGIAYAILFLIGLSAVVQALLPRSRPGRTETGLGHGFVLPDRR